MAENNNTLLENILNQTAFFAQQGVVLLRVDEDVVGGTTTTYIGTASPGTPGDKPRWQIRKVVVVVAGGATDTTITYPENLKGNADTGFKFLWDDRLSLTYK